MKKLLTKLLLVIFFLFCGWPGLPTAEAQPETTDVTKGSPDETPVPIDGGLAVLLLAGAGYGIKKYRSEKREKNRTGQPDQGK